MSSAIYHQWFNLRGRIFDGESARVNSWTDQENAAIEAHLLTQIAPQPSDVVLDYGCGNGMHLKLMSPKCQHMVGVDPNRRMIELAAANTDTLSNVEVKHVTDVSIDWPDQSFDKIYSWSVFEYMPDVDQAMQVIREFGRLVKPGGMILLGDLPIQSAAQYRDAGRSQRKLNVISRGMRLFNAVTYQKYNPDTIKAFCEQHIGPAAVLPPNPDLHWPEERFDVSVKPN